MCIRTICSVSIAAVLLLLAGCNEVEERLAWAPDGSRAVLRIGDQLHLLDTNGNVSASLASNIESAAWLPDGNSLAILRLLTATNWDQASKLLPPNELIAAQSLANGLPDLLKAALAAADGDSAATEEKFFKPLKIEFSELLPPAILCALDTQSAAMKTAIQSCKDPGKLSAEVIGLSTTRVAEVSVLQLAQNPPVGPPRVLERTVSSLEQPRPSPTVAALAFLRGAALVVEPLDGGTNRVTLDGAVAGFYDWTPDGKSIVYAVRLSQKDSRDVALFRIERRTVIDASGALIEGDVQPLAMCATVSEPRVQCLRDGRVLFAALSLELPAPVTTARQPQFYLIDPRQVTNARPVAIPCPPGPLPQELAYFVASPDAREIAVVESGSDLVAIVDVSTGKVEIVSPKRGWKSKMLPAWRGSDELYFAALSEAPSPRPELLRRRKGGLPQVISRGWTDDAVRGLLAKPEK